MIHIKLLIQINKLPTRGLCTVYGWIAVAAKTRFVTNLFFVSVRLDSKRWRFSSFL